ncbi:pantoate--beta-alanine ligase [Fredinandcohnia quinoae]|uniref:Pantothenate synthetase n=1 Tax=Fredinandcohnia quinoae TaxID=2918902 RepID=A0AAW5DXD0_9BACI|nr:pantoate--beta-alanine ligase [Fredinandcohnia sp. SECRCQ15]MCH1624718.1 pantoate--beta-alanine ligase [Fredinandcohnia sp. SECRCQ15]
MKVITSAREMQDFTVKERKSGRTVGFVPTMGYLHEGHMTLIKQARAENDIVVISIFVNPLQFGPNEDFDAYPRDFEHDQKMATGQNVDILFYPSTEEMYPSEPSLSVKVKSRVNVLCGRKRSGHFDGVATVLVKLFNIIMPDRAYFGLKDAQQVAVVAGLIHDFNFPIELIPVEIVREADGLAKSSRNVYLTAKERVEAPHLYKSLKIAKLEIQNGLRNPSKIEAIIRKHISNHTVGEIDYVEIYSYPELEVLPEISGKIIIAVAVKFTKARLIDNITFVV